MKPPCCDRAGFTYVVGGGGKIKIGSTTHIPSRLSALESSSPVPLFLLGQANGKRLEKLLHTMGADHRRHGEWFDEALWLLIEPLFAQVRCASCVLLSRGGPDDARHLAVVTSVSSSLGIPVATPPIEPERRLTRMSTSELRLDLVQGRRRPGARIARASGGRVLVLPPKPSRR